MKIDTLSLENFRGFQSVELALDKKSTVLFGWNGAGKSSLLDAVAILFSRYISSVASLFTKQAKLPFLNPQDIQRKIISRLQRVFPNIQFLLTTHSPQVLGEVRDMEIYRLESSANGTVSFPFPTVYGKDSNFILETTMDSSSRDEWERAKQLQQQLHEVLGYDESELVKADILYRRRRSLGR